MSKFQGSSLTQLYTYFGTPHSLSRNICAVFIGIIVPFVLPPFLGRFHHGFFTKLYKCRKEEKCSILAESGRNEQDN